MSDIFNLNRELINIFKSNVKDPFFVLDEKGNILSFNTEAESAFSITEKESNIFNLLDQDTSEKFNDMLQKFLQLNSQLEETLQIKLKHGQQVNVQMTINPLHQDDRTILLCTLKIMEGKFILNNKTFVKTKAGTDKLFFNSEVLKVIEEARKNYPFSFVSKNRIRLLANKLPEFFWIKNTKGNYILINDKLALSIGLGTIQIEGKPEKDFIPSYLINFRLALNQYIIESANCVILEDIHLKGFYNSDEYQTVEIPLFNNSNEIVAIVGIGQKKPAENKANHHFIKDYFDGVAAAVCYIDQEGMVSYYNEKFSELFVDLSFREVSSNKYFKIFPYEITQKISSFIGSSSDDEKFEIEKENRTLNFKLKKVKDNFSSSGILLTVEEKIPDLKITTSPQVQFIEKIIEKNPFPLFIFNKDNLKFLEVNEAALNLYDYSREEFLNLDLTDLYPQDELQSLLDFTSENVKEGIFYGPFTQKKKDGIKILIEVSKISIEYNGVKACFNQIKDASEEIRRERNLKLYKSIFDNTKDLIFITDDSGFISFINERVTETLNFSYKELEKTSLAVLFKDDKRISILNDIFNSGSHQTKTFDGKIKNSVNNYLSAELKAVPILNSKNVIETFLIMANIKEGENEIKEPSIKEEPESGTNPIFNDPEIISKIFHEILTPINVILGFVQELTGSIGNLTPEQHEAAEIIDQNRKNLLNIMNSVIDYINISGEKNIHIEEIGITELMNNIQNDLKNLIMEKGFQLVVGKISSSLIFHSDKEKFQNLISLLIILSGQINGHEKIYLSAFQYNEKKFILTIKDNYSFTSDKLIENLNLIINGNEINKNLHISRFTTLVVKKLYELLEGSTILLDENGKKEYGILFPIHAKGEKASVIPFEEEGLQKESTELQKEFDQHLEKLPGVPEKSLSLKELEDSEILVDENSHAFRVEISKLTCLYIEDQIDSQLLFKHQMKDLKEIRFAVSFEEALPLLQTNKFDFVLIDINLQGDYNGIDALKFIHKITGYENTPVIAATAYLLPGDRERFIAAGFTDFISKPIFYDNIIETLKKLF